MKVAWETITYWNCGRCKKNGVITKGTPKKALIQHRRVSSDCNSAIRITLAYEKENKKPLLKEKDK